MSITWLTSAGGLAEPVEMHGTAKETWTADKISCYVQLRCPWANRYSVLDNILLYAKAWPYHSTPLAYAISGDISNAEAANTADGSGLSYQEALLGVNFESTNRKEGEDPEDITIYDESLEPTAEFLTLTSDGFFWDNTQTDALKKEEAPGRLCIGLDYVVSYSNLSSIPAAALTLIGKVNNASVVSPSLGLTFAAETLLFNPPKITRKVTTAGTGKFTMQVRFTYRPDGWNKFWRAKDQDFVSMYDDTGALYKNFATASFAGVLP